MRGERLSAVADRWAYAPLAALLSLVLTSPLAAQVRQYTPPGGAGDEAAGRKKALTEAVENARWHAGPLRLDPAFWISDLAWVDRQQAAAGDDGNDLTARAGAGLRAYLPIASKTTVAAYALPEYIWWQDRPEERRVNQRFGLGSFTYFNRLAIAVTAKRDEDFDFATGEVLQRYTSRTEKIEVEAEVPVMHRLSIYAHGADSTVTSLVDQTDDPVLADFFADLDRDETAYLGGLRYYPSERVRLGAGVGHAETDFADSALDRSNAGDFWYVEAGYERPKASIELLYQENRLVATEDSGFSDFDTSTGGLRIEWRPREAFIARVYGSRQLAYSLLVADASAYTDELVGVGVDLALGWRMRLNLFGELGSHRYEGGGDGASAAGSDDVENFGIDLKIELVRDLSLRIGYQESRILPPSGSGRPEQKISQILANLGFGFGEGTWY